MLIAFLFDKQEKLYLFLVDVWKKVSASLLLVQFLEEPVGNPDWKIQAFIHVEINSNGAEMIMKLSCVEGHWRKYENHRFTG